MNHSEPKHRSIVSSLIPRSNWGLIAVADGNPGPLSALPMISATASCPQVKWQPGCLLAVDEMAMVRADAVAVLPVRVSDRQERYMDRALRKMQGNRR